MGIFGFGASRAARSPRVEEAVPDPEPWPEDDEAAYDPGTYQLTVLSGERVTLAAPVRYTRTAHLELSGAIQPFAPGQLLMLGGPDWGSFEIVQVEQGDSASGQATSCPVQRGKLRTLRHLHHAGTPVTPIAVERLPAAE